MILSFNLTKEDHQHLSRIAQRFCARVHFADPITVKMDVAAVHCNDLRLDLARLAEFDDFNLLHDVGGIGRHLDRMTGKLTDCFVPRCATGEAVAS